MDCDLGAAVPMPELRPHHEPIARLAAPVAVVCGDGHRGSALSTFDAERDGARDRRKVWTSPGYAGMAQSAAVAGAVVGVADLVGLAGIPTGHPGACREPPARPTASDAMARRDAPGLGVDGQSAWQFGVGRESEPERAGAQPAFRVARDAVPARNRCAGRFWKKANHLTHRERPWERPPALVILGSLT
jgi:hypothetical protein